MRENFKLGTSIKREKAGVFVPRSLSNTECNPDPADVRTPYPAGADADDWDKATDHVDEFGRPLEMPGGFDKDTCGWVN